VANGRSGCVTHLYTFSNETHFTDIFRTPLHIAICVGDLDIFRLLLSRGADPNFTSGDSETALAAAARHQQATMLKELLDHGADPNLQEATAVVSAAQCGYIEGMVMLMNHGADIHAQEGIPGKALHGAAHSAQINMVKLLLDKGVDVNSFGGEYGYVATVLWKPSNNAVYFLM
jgi:ankyrin repeat protein